MALITGTNCGMTYITHPDPDILDRMLAGTYPIRPENIIGSDFRVVEDDDAGPDSV